MAKKETGMVTASAPKSSSKKVNTVEARCTENGGYVVRLCHHGGGLGEYHEPEEFAFSEGDGGKVLGLIGKHLRIKGSEHEASEEEHRG